MKVEPARSFLDGGESALQPITLELAAPSPYRPEVTRASRPSSQEPDGWLFAHAPIVPQALNGFAQKNGDARRV
jgi:hypothetical protein